jgi:hypothetical protein
LGANIHFRWHGLSFGSKLAVDRRRPRMKRYVLTFFGGHPELRYSRLPDAAEPDREKHVAEWSGWIAGLTKAGTLEAGYP